MQDIVFYAAAGETLGLVRDYSNMNNSSAPILTLGISVCLKIRLFANINTASPYPIAKFNGITDWRWSMDSDFDRRTACKLVADAGGISVHTVTDTVNGETKDFTEFVIPISNMNTEELTEWLGNEKVKTGLTGELVGYDSGGNGVFVLQIEDFSVRNFMSGLRDPTAVDEGIVTRSIAEHMIQTAVSSSAATKQDKLNPSNGGTGIAVSSTGVISVSDIPQSAVTGLTASLTGLSASLAGKQNTLTAGYRMAIVNGSTVEQTRYFAIEPSITAPANQTTTVVLSAGKAYEIHAVAPNAKVLLNREEPVGGACTFGLEGHAEIYVANTGYVVTGSNVVLANPLEPDAVNNCTVRFHDGLAIISVEDHVAGYIVVSATGSTAGTLPYALSSASQEYVAFDATLNGQTLDLGGAVTNGEKHVVGNGYTETIISGGINCTSKTTFSNLGMNGVVVSSGTLTLGDVYIPNGATVAVSGGGLAIEKVTGNGGVIDLGGTNVDLVYGYQLFASGCTIAGGSSVTCGGIRCGNTNARAYIGDCVFSGNRGNYGGALSCESGYMQVSGSTVTGNVGSFGGGALVTGIGSATFTDTIISGNSPSNDLRFAGSGSASFSGCNIGVCVTSGGTMTLEGSNTIKSVTGSQSGVVTISSGAIVDLTGNANATPIAPGGGVTFAPGDATVYPSAGQASAYMLGGMTVPQIGNTNVVDLGGTHVDITSGSAFASGCIISGGSSTAGGVAQLVYGHRFIASNCTFAGNSASLGAAFDVWTSGSYLELDGCIVSGNYAAVNTINVRVSATVSAKSCVFGTGEIIGLYGSSYLYLSGSNSIYTVTGENSYVVISSGASINLTSSIAPGGGIVIPSGADVNINDNDYHAFGGITASSVNSSGYIGGATVSLPDGATCTYTYWSGGQSVTTSAAGPATVVVPGDLSYCGN